jgi:hypothetical protein
VSILQKPFARARLPDVKQKTQLICDPEHVDRVRSRLLSKRAISVGLEKFNTNTSTPSPGTSLADRGTRPRSSRVHDRRPTRTSRHSRVGGVAFVSTGNWNFLVSPGTARPSKFEISTPAT